MTTVPRFCPRCGSPLGSGGTCPACVSAPKRRRGLLVVAVLAAVLGVPIVTRLLLRPYNEKAEWQSRKNDVLRAAQGGTAGQFRRALDDAQALADRQGLPERMQELRSELDALLATRTPVVLEQIRALEEKGQGAEALTEWKSLWAVHQATPLTAGRTAREPELKAAGVRLAHELTREDLQAGRWGPAFERHTLACDLADDAAALHADMDAALRTWIEAHRGRIADAAASGDDRRIADTAGPAADILACLTAHDRRTKRSVPDLTRAFEEVLAPIPRRRIAVQVIGDAEAAQRVRSLCRFRFPWELVWQGPGEAAPPDAVAGVVVTVSWSLVDYRKTSGLTFQGDYSLREGVQVTCSTRGSAEVSAPWRTEWSHSLPAPERLEFRARDESDYRRSFDELKRLQETQLLGALRGYLDTWAPWELPRPK